MPSAGGRARRPVSSVWGILGRLGRRLPHPCQRGYEAPRSRLRGRWLLARTSTGLQARHWAPAPAPPWPRPNSTITRRTRPRRLSGLPGDRGSQGAMAEGAAPLAVQPAAAIALASPWGGPPPWLAITTTPWNHWPANLRCPGTARSTTHLPRSRRLAGRLEPRRDAST